MMKILLLLTLVAALPAQTVINGSQDWVKRTAPSSPASTKLRCYANTTTGTWECKDSSGNQAVKAATAESISTAQNANKVLAGPASGGDAAPTFRALVAADIPAVSVPTPGTSVSLTAAKAGFCIITGGAGTCTPPTPAAGYQYCARNETNETNAITLANISGVQYEATDRLSYYAANRKLVSGGAATDQICVVGRDATHYQIWSSTGTWTDTAP